MKLQERTYLQKPIDLACRGSKNCLEMFVRPSTTGQSTQRQRVCTRAKQTNWVETWARQHPDELGEGRSLACLHATVEFRAEPAGEVAR